MKHNPNKFADVGNICLDIFYFSLKLSDIENPPDIVHKINLSDVKVMLSKQAWSFM